MTDLILNRRKFFGQTVLASGIALGGVPLSATESVGEQPVSTEPCQDDDGVITYPDIHIADMMRGFPPPPEERVTIDNWAETTAHIRWAQQHSESVFRTLAVDRGEGPVRVLPPKMVDRSDFERAQVRWGPSIENAERISVRQWLDRSETDALVCLHDGHIVAECYFGDMSPRTRHHLMCGAKSILGTVLAPYLADGSLRAEDPLTKHIPEFADTGYEGATIRHLLDQTTSLDYEERWELTTPEWTWGTPEFRAADHLMAQCMRIGGLFRPLPGEENVGLQDFIFTLKHGEHRHGEFFSYKDANPIALQLILERLTDRSYLNHLSDLWQRLRPEGMMTVSTDNIGTPYGLAGLSCTARDWARWGEMVRNMGHIDGQLVFPGVGALIEEIRQDSGYRTETHPTSALPRTGYRNQFWTSVAEPGAEPLFYAHGAYFQNCLIDLRRKNVVVWMGSFWDRDADKTAQGHTCAHCEVGFASFVTEVLPRLVS